MNLFEFIASIIQSVIWPLVVFVFILLFREHVIQFIYSIRRVSFRQVRVDVGEQLANIESSEEGQTLSLNTHESLEASEYDTEAFQKLRKQVEDIAAVSPRAAILYTWTQVEESIQSLATTHRKASNIPNDWTWLIKKKILNRHMIKLLYKLHHLHEDVITNPDIHKISHSDSIRFYILAQRIIREVRKSTR